VELLQVMQPAELQRGQPVDTPHVELPQLSEPFDPLRQSPQPDAERQYPGTWSINTDDR
jgi:hypothetical protein